MTVNAPVNIKSTIYLNVPVQTIYRKYEQISVLAKRFPIWIVKLLTYSLLLWEYIQLHWHTIHLSLCCLPMSSSQYHSLPTAVDVSCEMLGLKVYGLMKMSLAMTQHCFLRATHTSCHELCKIKGAKLLKLQKKGTRCLVCIASLTDDGHRVPSAFLYFCLHSY